MRIDPSKICRLFPLEHGRALFVERRDAFAAAEFLMDYLKTRAPFWKREERPDGTSWVAAKDADDAAADRWDKPHAAE